MTRGQQYAVWYWGVALLLFIAIQFWVTYRTVMDRYEAIAPALPHLRTRI